MVDPSEEERGPIDGEVAGWEGEWVLEENPGTHSRDSRRKRTNGGGTRDIGNLANSPAGSQKDQAQGLLSQALV